MRILITGKNSYIGNSVKAWLNDKESSFIVDQISLRNINLQTISFKNYDVIFHVSGIAHISSNKKLIPQYFKVNRDLAIEVAKKSKEEGVKHFIFTSSIAIYGDDRPIGDFRPIEINNPSPNNAYGQSKFEAEIGIQKLKDHSFTVSILRIPMIYGKTAKGNFLKLLKISKKIQIFPKLKNYRSVLHIKNLSELTRQIIIKRMEGVLYPQDREYFDTTQFLVKNRKIYNKVTLLIPFLSIPIKILGLFVKSVNKVYGNKLYKQSISIVNNINYQIYSVDDVIKELKDI